MGLAGTLEIQMYAELARLSSDMAKSKKIIGDAVGDIEKLLATIGVGFSASLLLGKISSVVEGMAQLQRASEKTGASVEELSKLKFFASAAGTDIDSVTGALTKLSKNMVGTSNESAAASQAFKFLGISVKDQEGNLKSSDAVYAEIAKSLFNYADGAGKTAIAQALMGKAGAEQLAVMKKMIEIGDIEAKLTKEQAKQAEAYELALLRLKGQKEAVWKTVTSALLPSMESLVKVLIDASKQTGGLQNSAKDLAADGTIESWADNGAMAVAILIDAVKVLPAIFSAVGASAMVVGADIMVLVRSAALAQSVTQPWKFAEALGELKTAIAARNEILNDATAKYAAFLNRDVAATQKAMAAMIAARKAGIKDAGPEQGNKNLNFKLGDAAQIAAELKKYESALQALEQELGKLNNQTQEQKTLYQLTEGSLQKLTPAHAAHLLQVAREVDIKKQLLEIDKAALDFAKAQESEQDRMNATIASFNLTQSELLKNLEFETHLLQLQAPLSSAGLLLKADEIKLSSQLNLARDTAVALRQIDLNLEKELLKLGPETNANYEAAAQTLKDLAVAQKAAIPDALAMREGAKLANDLAKNQVDEFKALWSTVESTGKDVFVHVFSDGKGAFEGIGKALKASVIDLLYQLTAKKWLIEIGASVSGSVAGAAVSGGGGGGGGIMSLLGVGNSVSNIAGGAGSGLYGSFATSGVGEALGLSTYTAGLEGSMALSGAGAALGAAIPYVGAALAVGSALGLFGGGGKESSVLEGFHTKGMLDAAGFHGSVTAGDQLGHTWDATGEAKYLNSVGLQQLITLAGGAEALGDKSIPIDFQSGSDNTQILGGLQQAANAALAEIKKAVDAEKAASEKTLADAAAAAAKSLADAAAAADKLKTAWQQVTDSIVAEIDRIRGLNISPQSLAAAKAQFAISTAQARAGDIEAAKLLPGLSRSVIDMATAVASSALDIQRIRAQVLGSLEGTVTQAGGAYGLAIPSYASGTSYVPFTGPKMLHQGERVFTAQTNDELINEIRALRSEVAIMRKDTKKTSDNIEAVARGQLSFSTVPAT